MGQVGQASKTLGSTEPVLRTGNQTWLGDPAIANLWRFLAGKIAELQNITNVSDVFFLFPCLMVIPEGTITIHARHLVETQGFPQIADPCS